MKKIVIIIIIVGAVVVIAKRVTIKEFVVDITKPELPQEVSYEDIQYDASVVLPRESEQQPTESAVIAEEPIEEAEPAVQRTAVNLAVPFQPQAPYADWAMPYQEACEEASLIMVDYFYRGESLSREQMKKEIDDEVAWQEIHFGGHYDLPLVKVIELAEGWYDYDYEILTDLKFETITEQLNLGRPVIIPAAGRELGNPYYTGQGPLYHMLVIKGYTEDGLFITNDPGTRRGEDFLYEPDTLLSAIRDWDGDGPDGDKVGLIMY